VIYDGLAESAIGLTDPAFNTLGWKSSYTGLPIPAEEMREQVDHTVSRILARQPHRILEIGCGTGMLLFRLAPHCTRYVATDFLRSALDYVEQRVAERAMRCSPRLVHSRADDLSQIAGEQFDAVVLNSIVQHFPTVDYLLDLLRTITPLVDDGGFI